jgi:uncharacterized protein YndB with AHSA1/START domain
MTPRLRASVEVTVEVEIERPRPEVWAFISDFERIPEWLDEFETARSENDEPPGPGTVVHCTIRPGRRTATFELVEWDPPRRVTWDGPPLRWAGGAARPRGSHDLSEIGPDRTVLVSRYAPELTGTQALMRPYLRRWLRRQRAEDSRKLKSLLERPAENDR